MANVVSLNQIIVNAKANFIDLLQKTQAPIEKYNNAYGADDARADLFVVYSLLNLWLLIQFDSFLEVLDRRSNRVSRYVQLTEQDRIQFMVQYETITRASYCTKAMFEVEYFLNSLAEGLGIKTVGGYWNVTERMKKSLKLTDQQFKILNVPAAVRNSLHNNGYHMQKDFEVVIRGKSYKFEKGKQIMFSGWDNLYVMFDELLDVIVSIIESAEVKQLTKIPHTSMTYHDTQ
jgi:hypothetical protein